MSNSFYITTPLYYVNGEAHLGHAYTTILADVLARYHRLFGEKNVHLLTGLDEHGQKVSRAAVSENKSPQDHCDQMAVLWKKVWTNLGIQYDDFIRTTEPRHESVVRNILLDLRKKGDIYQKEYEGWYSVYEERFFTEKDLVDGKDPILGRPVEKIKENNYFFRMSKYQDWLIDHYEKNPDAVIPSFRLNEVKGFLKQPLGDLCISRPKSRLDWGISIPWDDEYVTYVWFDALINYYTATLTPPQGKVVSWPADYHLIGKDILTTHAVYWPIMLHAAGIEPPRHILAHGWWLDKDAARMSKSDGNVVNPLELAKKYGADEFRYYLMREMTIGQDANFSEEGLVRRINSDLANDLGNLYSRLAKLWHKFDWDSLPQKGSYEVQIDEELSERILSLKDRVKEEVENLRPHAAIEEILQVVRGLNWLVEEWEPWKYTKDTPEKAFAMMEALEALYKVAEFLEPVMPEKMAELKNRIYKGSQADQTMSPQLGEPLFPRIDMKELMTVETRLASKSGHPSVEEDTSREKTGAEITIEDFERLDLRVGEVIEASKVKGTNRLLLMKVDIGNEVRQIVAGIAESVSPEEIVGRQIIILVNLKPVKLRGELSEGMLLAAVDGDNLVLLTTDRKIKIGSKIS